MKFDCNGVNLFYEVKGDEKSTEVVAFFNGVMASTSSWYGCVPTLEKAGFKVVLHDFKGQMKSDKPVPEKGIYSFEEHAREAKQLFDSLGITKVTLVGTSYGGEVSMKFASMYPEMMKTLIIIDSVSEADEVCKNFVLSWKTLCDCYDGEKFFYGMAPSIYGPDYYAKNKELLDNRAKATKAVDNSYFDGQKILYDTFAQDVYMTDQLHKITCPTLIICGQDDILKPQRLSEIIYQNIKNSEFVIFPHCGHVTIFEQQETLNTNILGFVMKHR